MNNKIVENLLYVLKRKTERVKLFEANSIQIDFKEDELLYDIIFDVIGFPYDNTIEFDNNYLINKNLTPQKGLRVDYENMFCRDWLYNKLFDYLNNTSNIKTENKLIEWLYLEKQSRLELFV